MKKMNVGFVALGILALSLASGCSSASKESSETSGDAASPAVMSTSDNIVVAPEPTPAPATPVDLGATSSGQSR